MSQETLLKHQFTIQNFNFPIKKSEPSASALLHKRQKPSLHSNYQSERRIICAQATTNQLRDRWSGQIEAMDPNPQRFASLPEIKGKSKGNDVIASLGQNRLQSFSSRKLNVNAYRKIGESINKKYYRKMQCLALTEPQTKKVFSIKTLRGDLITPKLPQRGRQERVQKHAIDSHHIDRFKDHQDIPLELQTQRYREQEFDDRQQSLQLKNIIRFELYSNMILSKPKKQQQEQHIAIDGWVIDTSTLRHAAQLYS